MKWRNTDDSYGRISRIFHWLLFLLIAMMIIGALSTEGMPKGPEKAGFVQIHKSLGATILLLVALRLLWRALNPLPRSPLGAPHWQTILARLNHYALYLAMLAQPISGILMSQAAGRPVRPFGLFTLPALVAPDKSLAHALGNVHGTVWIILVTLVALHVIAVLYHHWGRRDAVLRRMLVG